MAEGLLVIRLVVGLLLFGHGAQKLFGWYGGHGLDGTGGFFDSLGHRPGRTMAALAGASEAGGGLLLTLGILTPLGAAMVIGVMTVAAVSVHAPNGLWATNGGYELPLVLGCVAGGIAFTGAGPWSVDEALGLGLSGWGTGLGAVVVGVAAASVLLWRRQRMLTAEHPPPPEQGLDAAYPADPAAASTERGVTA